MELQHNEHLGFLTFITNLPKFIDSNRKICIVNSGAVWLYISTRTSGGTSLLLCKGPAETYVLILRIGYEK